MQWSILYERRQCCPTVHTTLCLHDMDHVNPHFSAFTIFMPFVEGFEFSTTSFWTCRFNFELYTVVKKSASRCFISMSSLNPDCCFNQSVFKVCNQSVCISNACSWTLASAGPGSSLSPWPHCVACLKWPSEDLQFLFVCFGSGSILYKPKTLPPDVVALCLFSVVNFTSQTRWWWRRKVPSSPGFWLD